MRGARQFLKLDAFQSSQLLSLVLRAFLTTSFHYLTTSRFFLSSNFYILNFWWSSRHRDVHFFARSHCINQPSTMVNVVNDPGVADPISSPEVYTNAIILPLLAFPVWILCCIPMSWHFSQHNIAAGSLILWAVLLNFFNSINPLIWPNDNLDTWWHGHGWCDINIRIQVGGGPGIAACAAMIIRKLAMVMDTSKMTVTSSRSPGINEKLIELAWCWGWPLVLIGMHAIVSGVRYMIFGVVGCISEYHASWPSIALGYIWSPITTLVAVYYAGKSLQQHFNHRH